MIQTDLFRRRKRLFPRWGLFGGFLWLLMGCAGDRFVVPGSYVDFSGYRWEIKEGDRLYPGPNRFGRENIRLDRHGRLHLRINRHEGQWSCAEVTLDRSLGYGTYRFLLATDPDRLDPQTVLGLFTYDDNGDHHREIDIEWSKWGRDDSPNAVYSVQPAEDPGHSNPFEVGLEGRYSLHQFAWSPDSVVFESRHGHLPGGPLIARWVARSGIPVPGDERVRINLWLFRGQKGTRSNEVVIRRFEFIPSNH